MRILTAAILMGTAALAVNTFSTPKTDGFQIVAETKDPAIDPIITGQTVSAEDIEEWEERRKKFLDCKDCNPTQPYPGD